MAGGRGHDSEGSSSARGAEHGRASVGRKLFGTVKLWQDWGEEAAESDPKYWELFTDLILVAAASAIADTFESKQNWGGLLEFVLLFSAIIHGWSLYNHYSSRFLEASLVHSFILFFYFLGMAGTVVNASFETAQEFSLGVVLQRSAVLVMMLQVMYYLPRARRFATVMVVHTWIGIAIFLTATMFGAEENFYVLVSLWGAAAFIDFFTEIAMVCFISRQALVPINIHHAQERLSVMILVMMGETVISATMMYREYKEKGLGTHENQQLYLVLAFSFLLVFMLTLIYFHVQPHPDNHAFRRSRLTGITAVFLNKVLGLTLLTVGVCIKMAVNATAAGSPMKLFTCHLFNFSVGGSLVLLLGMRCCHYLGKMPHPSFPLHIQQIMWAWWALFAFASMLPFFFPHWDGQPIPCLIVASLWLAVLCIVETSFTHILGQYVVVPQESEEDQGDDTEEKGSRNDGAKKDETTSLLSKDQPMDQYSATGTHGGGPSQYVLVLVSKQSLDRNVLKNQHVAETILIANKIQYKTLDGADPENKTRRNELFWMSGLTAKYPQFFVVEEDNEQQTAFWGDWDKFETTNEINGISAAFASAIAK